VHLVRFSLRMAGPASFASFVSWGNEVNLRMGWLELPEYRVPNLQPLLDEKIFAISLSTSSINDTPG
jgi:hypothetical protein